jgi:hypothetical protein
MKTRLHFGLLVILLAFLGTYLEQSTVHNQQIVIQFSDQNIDEKDAEIALETIKKQLQTIGIDFIKINQNDDGQLKITYYSTSDIAQIEALLTNGQHFKLTYGLEDKSSDVPEHKSSKDYELNISEIKNSNHIKWDFERAEIVQLNQKSDHSNNPRVNTSSVVVNENYFNGAVHTNIRTNHAIAIAIDNYSYMIPEVRAGPFQPELYNLS